MTKGVYIMHILLVIFVEVFMYAVKQKRLNKTSLKTVLKLLVKYILEAGYSRSKRV